MSKQSAAEAIEAGFRKALTPFEPSIPDAALAGNSRQVASRLDDDEKDAVTVNDSMGRPQQTTIVNESGLYNALRKSDKPFAKRFWRWVTHEVLPSIRKTGSYTAPGAAPAIDTTALAAAVGTRIRVEGIGRWKFHAGL